MKKLIALLCFVTLSASVFALNAWDFDEAVDLLKKMAAKSSVEQAGNIDPAIAHVMDAYHGGAKDYADVYVAEIKLTFADGQEITLGEWLDTYTHSAQIFETFAQEIKNVTGDEAILAQNILQNMADPMKKMTDEQAAVLAKRYIKYSVNGHPLVNFTRNPGVRWADSALDELESFGDRIERLAR